MKRAARLIGYFAWFMFCFLVGVYLTFPMDALKPLLVAKAEQALGKGKQGPHGVDPAVTVGDLAVSGFGVSAERLSVQLASRDPDPGPTLDVDYLRVGISPFSLLTKSKSVSVMAELWDGEIDADVDVDDKGAVSFASIDVSKVDLAKSPLILAKLGMPVSGVVKVRARLDMGKVSEKDAGGKIEVDVKGLAVGPGNLKAVPGGFEIAEPISLGNIVGQVPIAQGKATIEKLLIEGATDVEVELAGALTIRSDLVSSRIDVDGWFKPTTAFLEKNQKIQSAIEIAEKLTLPGAPSLAKAKDADGRYHFNLKGTIQAPSASLSRDAGRRSKAKTSGTAPAAPERTPPERTPPPRMPFTPPAPPPAASRFPPSAEARDPAPDGVAPPTPTNDDLPHASDVAAE